jgi:hypothetical protein
MRRRATVGGRGDGPRGPSCSLAPDFGASDSTHHTYLPSYILVAARRWTDTTVRRQEVDVAFFAFDHALQVIGQIALRLFAALDDSFARADRRSDEASARN